jgi:cytosine/adenosine deaminase-related metal-dependent hydrolase
MRILLAACGLVAAVVFVALAGVFDLNGGQWDWWRDASWAAAVASLVLAVRAALRVRTRVARPRAAHALGLLCGSIAVGVSVDVMARRYSDPYAGPLLWPHVLAVVAFAGVVVVIGSVVALLEGGATS